MDMEYNYGQMVLSMRDNGIITKQKERVLFGMLRETYMKGNLKMTRQMVLVFTLMLMDPSMKATGKTICKKDMVARSGVTALSILAHTFKEKSTITESIYGLINLNMKEIGMKIKLKDLVFIHGLMVEDLRVIG